MPSILRKYKLFYVLAHKAREVFILHSFDIKLNGAPAKNHVEDFKWGHAYMHFGEEKKKKRERRNMKQGRFHVNAIGRSKVKMKVQAMSMLNHISYGTVSTTVNT